MAKPKLNLIDKAVSFFSPRSGFKRQHYRQLEQRLYEAASAGRRNDGWFSSGTDANAEAGFGMQILANRARDLVRNEPYAEAAVEGLSSNVIGTGIMSRPLIGDKEDSVRLKAWKKWAESTKCDSTGQLNLAGLQELAFSTIVVSGSVLVRRVRVIPTKEDPIPLKLMLLEPDYLVRDKQGTNIVQGIEFDKNGKPAAYYLYDRHPGDSRISGGTSSTRVPASEILHVFRAKRAGQVIGVSWFAPVMQTLKDLGDVMDATIYKQKVAAAFAAFVHDIEAVSEGQSTTNPPISSHLEPGIIEILPPGKDITFANPPSTSDFDPFTKTVLRSVAKGLGMTYEELTGDLSNTSFSSARMGWIAFHRHIEKWRWLMFMPKFQQPVCDWFDEAAAIAGVVDESQDTTWIHTPPKREMIDPVSETRSSIDAVRGGIKTLRQVHEELGEDSNQILADIEATNKVLDEKHIILDSDPRRIMKAGSLQMGLDSSKVGDMEDAAPDDKSDVRYFVDDDGVVYKRDKDGIKQLEE